MNPLGPASNPVAPSPGGGADRPRRILVVDDEPTIRRVVQAYLHKEGFEVAAVGDGLAAWEAFGAESPGPRPRPDLVILDLMLPGISGWELCRRMQAVAPSVPIILLTARGEETDRIVGLRLGADDYVSKPFSPAELVARVQAVLRRVEQGRAQASCLGVPASTVAFRPGVEPAATPVAAAGSAAADSTASAASTSSAASAAPAASATNAQHRFGPLAIDPGTFQVWVHGRDVKLTATEFRLLEMMARHPLQVFSRAQLLAVIAGDVFAGYERNVDTHIKNVRHKLATAGLQPPPIETIYRVGYRFRPPA